MLIVEQINTNDIEAQIKRNFFSYYAFRIKTYVSLHLEVLELIISYFYIDIR